MFNRNELRANIEVACNILSSDELDYTLQQVVDILRIRGHVDAMASTDAIILNGESFPMDGSTWLEAGHQYSHHKQWWPLPDRI